MLLMEYFLRLGDEGLDRRNVGLVHCRQPFPPEQQRFRLLDRVRVARELPVRIVECTAADTRFSNQSSQMDGANRQKLTSRP